MKRILVLCSATILLLASCIGVDSSIELSSDGSGRLELEYRVSQAVRNIGRGGEDDTLLPLPLEREAFERVVAQNDGLALESYARQEDAEQLVVQVEVTFDKPTDLNTLFGEDTVRYLQQDGTTVLEIQLYSGVDEPLEPESLDLLRTFFAEYQLSVEVTAPSAIDAVSQGTLAEGRRTAEVSFYVHEILPEQEPVTWQVRW